MLLQPKKTKYKKIKKGKIPKFNFNNSKLNFGIVGLKAVESGLLTSKQIEAARQTINRKIKRKGKIWIKVYPSIPITSKPTAARMGKGKGTINHWAAKISTGTILFEICGSKNLNFIDALKLGSSKLPLKTKIVY